jgi:glycosyltransferase involved in cell wall biosynthesis
MSEARRVARWEAEATGRVTITVAITQRDAGRLERLAPGGSLIRVVRAPMPRELGSSAVLSGTPSIVLFSNRAWLPNRDGVEWFLREVWPAVRSALPDARLHVFGPTRMSEEGSGVHVHPAPADSQEAFSQNSVLAVPLRMASGVRIKILEAWARGMPVVATPVAALGLDIPEGQGVRLASTRQDFVEAFRELGTSPTLAQQLVAEGRAMLDEWHHPQRLAEELERVYAAACARTPGR